MNPESLLDSGRYSLDWIKHFYTQAGVWWGDDPQAPGVHLRRLETVERLCGPGPKRILELGAGTGATAAVLADAGHTVVAVELAPSRAAIARERVAVPRRGLLEVVEGDFFAVALDGRFDIVACWETFGLGADADQRRLLRRMAADWLTPGGSVLLEVYSPFLPARLSGTEQRLPPLQGVPGSVEMINRCCFDVLHGRWLDEWQPVAAPELALTQTVRCYTPPDFLLLLEGTGLAVAHAEVEGQPLDLHGTEITTSGPLHDTWTYLVRLVRSPQTRET